MDESGLAAAPSQKMAMASLVCALLFCIPVVPQALAVILGLIALLRGAQGRGVAVAALVIALLVAGGWAVLLRSTIMRGSTTITATPWAGPGSPGPSPQVDQGKIMSDLEQIGLALNAYVRDMGQWPDKLETMVPTYLTRRLVDRCLDDGPDDEPIIRFISRIDPARDAPSRVVAFSARFDEDRFGDRLVEARRWVLLLNGEVHSVEAAKVESAVANEQGPGPAITPADELE
ncbi:MAG: DUF4190 domain-containing protein [Phycisphaerae bacterium]